MTPIRQYLAAGAALCAAALPLQSAVALDVTDSVSVTGTSTFLLLNSSSSDWTMRANTNGNLTFSTSGAVVPFTMVGTAPDDAMFLNSSGNLGLGTTTPGGSFSARLHISDPTPDILLDDSDDSQLWYLFADFEGMGFADETSSTIPFFVESGAPFDSLVVKSNGFVGLGTFDPDASFHVQVNDGAFNLPFVIENTNGINFSGFRLQISPTSWVDFNNAGGKFRINANQVPGAEFEVQPNGNAILSGVLTQNSDVNAKQDIVAVQGEGLLDKVMQLPISEWSYKDDPQVRHLGPMAQDFHRLFALGDTDKGLTSIDTGGVALAAIQAVKREKDQEIAGLLAAKDAEISALRADMEQTQARQEERILQLEMALTQLLAKQSGDVQVSSAD